MSTPSFRKQADPAREDALRDMLRTALDQPGVYEAMEVYEHCQKNIRVFNSFWPAAGMPPTFMSTSSSSAR